MIRHLALPLLLVAVTPGCVLDRSGQSATEAWRREMAIQSTRTLALQESLEDVTRRVDQIEEVTRARGQEEILRMETVDQIRSEVARIRGDVEVIQHSLGISTESSGRFQEDTDYRLAFAEARLALLEKNLGLSAPAPPPRKVEGSVSGVSDAAGGDGVAKGESGSEAGDSGVDEAALKAATPDELLALAESHMRDNKPKAARAVLERFIVANPKHERLSEAHYRLGQALFADKEYQRAVLSFQEVLDKYKDSPWAPWAMLRQGESFAAMGKKDNAQLFFDEVIRLYPKSKAAKEAKEKKARK
jgi:tol-pal system protein YbgF